MSPCAPHLTARCPQHDTAVLTPETKVDQFNSNNGMPRAAEKPRDAHIEPLDGAEEATDRTGIEQELGAVSLRPDPDAAIEGPRVGESSVPDFARCTPDSYAARRGVEHRLKQSVATATPGPPGAAEECEGPFGAAEESGGPFSEAKGSEDPDSFSI